MGFVAALFVGVLGWLLVHDIRTHKTGLATIRAHRGDKPAAYWAVMAFWLLCLVVSALFALDGYFPDPACEGVDNCIVVVSRVTPE